MELSGGKHIDKGTHASAALFNEVIPRMDGELSNRRRVPAQTRSWQEIELSLSTKRTVDEQHPARGKHFNIFGKGRPGHRIDNSLNAAAVRNLSDTLADFSLFAIDNVICTKITDKACLLFAAHYTDHFQIRCLRQVNQRIAHAAGGGKDQYCLSLSKAQSIVEDMISDLIVGERCRGLEVHRVGQEKSRLSKRRHVFCVVTAAMWSLARSRIHPLTLPASCHARSYFLDNAG